MLLTLGGLVLLIVGCVAAGCVMVLGVMVMFVTTKRCSCQREYTEEEKQAKIKGILQDWHAGEVDTEQCFDCTTRKAGCTK